MCRLIVCLIGFLSAFTADGGDLRLEVVEPIAVLPAEEVRDGTGRTPIVSNIEPISLRFTIEHPELVKGSPTGTSPRPDFELTAFDETGKSVPVRHSVTGVGGQYDVVTVDLSVEIPIDPAERRRQIEEWFDEVAATATDPKHKEYLSTNREFGIAYFDQLFLQNRLGGFRLRVSIIDPRVEPVEDEVRLRVIDRGVFTDKLRQRPPEAEER